MLPNIDPAGATPAAVTPTTTKRSEMEKAVTEVYQAPAPQSSPAAQKTSDAPVSDSAPSRAGTDVVQRVHRTPGKAGSISGQKTAQDQAEINFQLTREEREVFLNAISGTEEVSEMTEEEQSTLQRAAERIEKLIEEADTRTAEGRERMDRAIKEWYSRLANGKHKAPTDLLRLIQAAAAGRTDLQYL